jgi:formate dehydrogenase subunit delta
MSPDNKLVYMANQIGKFFEAQKHADPAKGIADHLAHFWDPSMRAKIIRHLELGGAGLDPAAKDAVRLLAPIDSSKPALPVAASR